MRRLLPLLLIAIGAAACDDQALTSRAYGIIEQLHGSGWEPGPSTQYGCPAPSPGGPTTYHWGVFYPPGYYHPGIGDYTVCFTAGLSRDDLRHGTVALHETGHLWFQRLREKRLFDPNRTQEERYSDCFARIFGGQPSGIHYGCTAGEESVVRSYLGRYPETGRGWFP